MNRRNVLLGMVKWLTGCVALLPIKTSTTEFPSSPTGVWRNRHEYPMSEFENAKELAGVLQDAVSQKRLKYYTVEFQKSTIVLHWRN
jgi:hypothetical protein